MKTSRALTLALAAALCAACSGSSWVEGDWGGKDCGWLSRISFRKGGQAYITYATGMEMPATWRVDGDKVSLGFANAGIVFTRHGDVLQGTLGGAIGAMSCRRL